MNARVVNRSHLAGRAFRGRECEAGWHAVRFRAGGLPSGVYAYRLRAGRHQKAKQMVVVR